MAKYEVTITPNGLGFLYVIDAVDSSAAIDLARKQLEDEAGDQMQVDAWVQTIIKHSQQTVTVNQEQN